MAPHTRHSTTPRRTSASSTTRTVTTSTANTTPRRAGTKLATVVRGLLGAVIVAGTVSACSPPDDEPSADEQTTASSESKSPTSTVTSTKSSASSTSSTTEATSASSSPTTTSETEPSTTDAEQPGNGEEQPGNGTPSTPEEVRRQFADQVGPGFGIGSPVTLGASTYTTCVCGDGFGLSIVAVGGGTSCEFAQAVQSTLTQGINPTYDNVRDHLPATVDAHSPVTGATYSMQCSADQAKVVHCTGGNNAHVVMY